MAEKQISATPSNLLLTNKNSRLITAVAIPKKLLGIRKDKGASQWTKSACNNKAFNLFEIVLKLENYTKY